MEFFYKIVTGEEKYVIGMIRGREGCTFAKICAEIVEYHFDFI